MASLDLREEDAWIRLTRSERIWSLSGDIALPYPSIVGVDVEPAGEVGRGWFRVGTGVPRRYHAGHFWSRQRSWEFWVVARADSFLVIDLRDHRYDRIVVEVEDPDSCARNLRARL